MSSLQPLSDKGVEALVAMCRYIAAHGNVAREARFIALLLLRMTDHPKAHSQMVGTPLVKEMADAISDLESAS